MLFHPCRETAVLDHPDHDDALRRAEFHICGVGSAVAEPVGINGQAESVTVGDGLRSLSRCQLLERRFTEVTLAVQLAVVQQHLTGQCCVQDRRTQPAGRHREPLAVFVQRVQRLAEGKLDETVFCRVRTVRIRQASSTALHGDEISRTSIRFTTTTSVSLSRSRRTWRKSTTSHTRTSVGDM